jgi:hypothetical protein
MPGTHGPQSEYQFNLDPELQRLLKVQRDGYEIQKDICMYL